MKSKKIIIKPNDFNQLKLIKDIKTWAKYNINIKSKGIKSKQSKSYSNTEN